jgi:murein DD-endopeptidase MepM/ murein hydrolase activator NlpD
MWGGLRARRRVRVGSILGYVGNTGNAATTPPHLHYGIYTASGAINPYPLLKAVSA